MKKIVIFASGSGSNAEKIIEYFKDNRYAAVSCILCNNADAKVLQIAKNSKIATITFDRDQLQKGYILEKLIRLNPDLLVLAGFLLKFPLALIEAFENKVINIHPALLPKYGGKGMYGLHVHNAVLKNNETESGITIHYVNEHYDEGAFIFQKSIAITDCKTPEEIAVKILQLEHRHYAQQIEQLLNIKSL